MPLKTRILVASLAVALLGILQSACVLPAGARAGEEAGFKQENRPENLKAFMETLHRTIYLERDPKSALASFNSLLPDETRIRRALREGAPPESLRKILDMHEQHRAALTEAEVTKLAKPEQTVVEVSAQTAEALARSPNAAWATILRPGTTFFQVSFLEPGKSAGMKYHLFFWDGGQWTMLGPVWRALR